MEQLLDIKTVPIALEMHIQPAKLEYTQERASQNVTRVDGSFQVQHKFPRIQIDSTQMRNSMNLKSAMQSSKDAADAGMQAALEATAQIAEEGNALMDIQDGMNVPTLVQNIDLQRIQSSMDTIMTAMPSVPADISWDPAMMSMRYDADKLVFDWRTSRDLHAEYVPAKVEFHVKQYPHVEITYVGKPNYVPPSADPDYEPPVLNVSA